MSEINKILLEAKDLAKRYRALTGKPLGITGEVAEFSAAEVLGLDLAAARQAGYDALWQRNGKKVKVQIKGRCLMKNCKPGQRVGSIKLTNEWDITLLVLMDENFELVSIYEAGRSAIKKALTEPGSKARNERGSLAVSKFKSIGRQVWSKDQV
ncbi:MAG: hypothetical protein AB1650_01690 [Candidatus Omnitrophota bacterium]